MAGGIGGCRLCIGWFVPRTGGDCLFDLSELCLDGLVLAEDALHPVHILDLFPQSFLELLDGVVLRQGSEVAELWSNFVYGG